MIASYLPILLEERFGPRVWGWFDKEAAQEYLGNAYFDLRRNRLAFDQCAIRGATGELAELSDMMYSMDFENLEDESLGDNSVEKFDDLELELLVDPTTKFGIPPAYDTQSQASFATLCHKILCIKFRIQLILTLLLALLKPPLVTPLELRSQFQPHRSLTSTPLMMRVTPVHLQEPL
jgi:hypothetical protein